MIQRVAVVGAGTMGQGIARSLAQAGIDVIIKELNDKNVQSALKQISKGLDQEIAKWGITKSEKAAMLSRIKGTSKYEELKNVDFVIESIVEDFEAKSKVFKELDKALPPEVTIVSNTSALSITELAACTQRPERVAGLHFVNPVPKRLVAEVVRGLHTSNETVAQVKELARSLGKTPVEVFEYPGYITTRIILPLLNEAMHVVMEGVASAEDVDTAMQLGYDLPVGPLEMADQMGLEEVESQMETLFRELGDLKFRPCPLLRKMVRAGHWGVKSRRGFFRYDENGNKVEQQKRL